MSTSMSSQPFSPEKNRTRCQSVRSLERTQCSSTSWGGFVFFCVRNGVFWRANAHPKKNRFSKWGFSPCAPEWVFFACGMWVFAMRGIGFFRMRSRNGFLSARNWVTHCARARGHLNAPCIVLNRVFPCTVAVLGLFQCETERLTARSLAMVYTMGFLAWFARNGSFLCAVEVHIVLAIGGRLSAFYALSVCS